MHNNNSKSNAKSATTAQGAAADAHPHRAPILALRFHGAAPSPHSPVLDPTPDQMFELACEQKAKDVQEQKAVNSEKTADASTLTKLGGVLSSAAAAVGNAVASTLTSTERALRDRDHKLGEERLALNFPELVSAGDRFIVQYAASVMNKGKAISGHILLTSRHVCFVNATIKDSIPLDTVVSIQPSVALKTFHQEMLYFMPIPKNYVMPDAIQLFLSDHKVLQFLEFDTAADKALALSGSAKCRSIDCFYNWIDHQWRKSVRVPLEGVQYTHHTGEHVEAQHREAIQHHEQHRESIRVQPLQAGAAGAAGAAAPTAGAGLAGAGVAGAAGAKPATALHTEAPKLPAGTAATTGAGAAKPLEAQKLPGQQAPLGAQRDAQTAGDAHKLPQVQR